MILPPEDSCRNKLSRKSRAKAMARAQGKKKKQKRKQKQQQQPASNKSQKLEEAPKMAPRGGLPIATAAGLDQLEQVNRNAAGIDLGATVHFVAVPPGRDPETHVRCFETFTADLQALADWLEQCGIETVAMESTGVPTVQAPGRGLLRTPLSPAFGRRPAPPGEAVRTGRRFRRYGSLIPRAGSGTVQI